jgi:hypothetical protein
MTDDENLSDTDHRVLESLKHLPAVPRPDDLHEQFRERMRAERIVGSAWRPWIITAIAATLVLALGSGWWIDRAHHISEVSQLRAQLIDALNGTSAPRRFEAINVAGNSSLRDQQVVDALTHALLTDPNTNVRVAAAEALGRVADLHSLAEAAERSFGREGSPFVQTELLRSVDRLDPVERKRVVSALLSRRDIDASVRVDAARMSGT